MIRPAHPDDGPTIADIFLLSFRATLPEIRLVHDDDEIREHFATVVTNDMETWVAVEDAEVVGFVTLSDDSYVNQLYLRPGKTGNGIGSDLLAHAKVRRPGGLRLFAFQANTGACRFYEHHGFEVVDLNDGSRNEEGEPDVLYEWRPN